MPPCPFLYLSEDYIPTFEVLNGMLPSYLVT